MEKKIRDRKQRHRAQCELALQEFDKWADNMGATAANVGIVARAVNGR
jgi:hypothetical protein